MTIEMITQSVVEVLIKAGSNADKPDRQIIDLLEPIRKHDFVNRQAPAKWTTVTDLLPVDQHIALLKGIVLAEKGFKWIGGSAAAGIWIFRSLVKKIDLVQQTHLTLWVLNNTRNDYLPTGFRSGNDSYLFLASAAPKFIDENDLTWAYEKAQSHCAYEKARNDNYQEQLAAQKNKRDKRLQEKKLITDMFVKRREKNSSNRDKFKIHFNNSSEMERFAFVIEQDKLPLAAFPTEWTEVSLAQILDLPLELRVTVLERIKAKSKGPWRELAKLIKMVERENKNVYLNQ